MFWKSMISGQMPDKTQYDHFINVNDANLHYREYPADTKKKAQHIVLLHGFSSSTYTWEKIDYMLHEEGYHVWSLDMKGFGWSDKPINSDYNAITLMEEVNRWMELMKLENVIFVGNSYGGGIATLLAFNYPKRIKKIVLIDAAAYRMKLPYIVNIMRLPLARYFAKYVFSKWMVKMILKEVYYHKKRITDEQVDEYYKRLTTAHALAAQISLVKEIDFDLFELYTKRIGEIKQKTLIIWGGDDKWIPLHIGYEFNKNLINAKMIIIPECGHIPQEEKPELVFKLIADFADGKDVYKTFKGKIEKMPFILDEY